MRDRQAVLRCHRLQGRVASPQDTTCEVLVAARQAPQRLVGDIVLLVEGCYNFGLWCQPESSEMTEEGRMRPFQEIVDV